LGLVEKQREPFEGPDQADAVHQKNYCVEALSCHRGEVSAARVGHPALAHDLHRFRRHIDRGHFEPASLELERVPTGSCAEISGR